MANGKKTVGVAKLVVYLNRAIQNAKTRAEKRAFCLVIEKILFDSNNYEGFGYLFDWNSKDPEWREHNQYHRFYYHSDTIRKELNELAEKGDSFVLDTSRGYRSEEPANNNEMTESDKDEIYRTPGW